MHSVRVLLDLVPELLVEQRAFSRARRAVAGDTMGQGFARRGHRRAARQSRRPVPALSLPHHHELRQGLPEESQSLRGHCRTQAEVGRTADLISSSRRTPGPITTIIDCCKRQLPIALRISRGVWVPAFAGTTMWKIDC